MPESHSRTQRHTDTQTHRGHAHTLHIWQLTAQPSPGTSCLKPQHPHMCRPGSGVRPGSSAHKAPRTGQPCALWVGSRGAAPLFLASTHPSLPVRPSPAPWAQDYVSPAPQVTPALLHPSHAFKGPHLPELLPTREIPAFSRGTVPQFLPVSFPASGTPIPVYTLPTPILTPFLAVQALSLPKLSCCRGW